MSASAPTSRRLDGRGIVVTRPAEQAGALAQSIRDLGGRPILFPVIGIEDIADPERLNSVIDRLATFDIAIFISPNAAARGMRAVRARAEFPDRLQVLAIGHGTARELHRQGLSSVIVPEKRFDSESLLMLPEMQGLAGRSVVIFRGEGGRALLGDALLARGAKVEYAECYKRVKLAADVEPLAQAWSRGEVDAVVVTSSEGLRNLYGVLGDAGRKRLATTQLFAPHARIASTARELGLCSVTVTPSGDEAIARAIAEHFATRR